MIKINSFDFHLFVAYQKKHSINSRLFDKFSKFCKGPEMSIISNFFIRSQQIGNNFWHELINFSSIFLVGVYFRQFFLYWSQLCYQIDCECIYIFLFYFLLSLISENNKYRNQFKIETNLKKKIYKKKKRIKFQQLRPKLWQIDDVYKVSTIYLKNM